MKQLIIACLCIITGIQYAQAETRKLTLDEAIELGLKNSNQLKLSAAKLDEVNAQLREAKDRMLPDFSVSGSYLRVNQPNVDLKIKTGGQQQPAEGQQQSATSSIKVDEAMYGIANLSLPVFSGFRIKNGIEAAKYLAKAATLDAEHDREEVIANLIAAYSNLYKAKEALTIVNENLKQSKQRVADMSNLEQNGLLARNDLLKAQLQQSNIELSVLEAENNWKITYINMNLMLGLPEETELEPDANSFAATDDNKTFEEWQTLALENRKDLSALSMRSKAANAGIQAAKGEYYPSLALTGGYIAANVPGLLTLTNALNAGVGVKYSPSSLWKAPAKIAAAKAQKHQADIGRDIMSDAVRLQTAEAYQKYLLTKKKTDVYAKAMEQANENYRIVKNKYDNSLATTTDLLDADVAQLQAKLNVAFAKADVMVAYKKLQQTAGILSNNTNQ